MLVIGFATIRSWLSRHILSCLLICELALLLLLHLVHHQLHLRVVQRLPVRIYELLLTFSLLPRVHLLHRLANTLGNDLGRSAVGLAHQLRLPAHSLILHVMLHLLLTLIEGLLTLSFVLCYCLSF